MFTVYTLYTLYALYNLYTLLSHKYVTKNFDAEILELKNLNIIELEHNDLEFLQLKGLLNKDLIRPLYLG